MEYFFFGLASLSEARQSISRSISFSLMIIDSEVVLRELLSPADLTRAHAFCIYELMKVIMVSKDEDLILAALHVVALCLESLNDG